MLSRSQGKRENYSSEQADLTLQPRSTFTHASLSFPLLFEYTNRTGTGHVNSSTVYQTMLVFTVVGVPIPILSRRRVS